MCLHLPYEERVTYAQQLQSRVTPFRLPFVAWRWNIKRSSEARGQRMLSPPGSAELPLASSASQGLRALAQELHAGDENQDGSIGAAVPPDLRDAAGKSPRPRSRSCNLG